LPPGDTFGWYLLAPLIWTPQRDPWTQEVAVAGGRSSLASASVFAPAGRWDGVLQAGSVGSSPSETAPASMTFGHASGAESSRGFVSDPWSADLLFGNPWDFFDPFAASPVPKHATNLHTADLSGSGASAGGGAAFYQSVGLPHNSLPGFTADTGPFADNHGGYPISGGITLNTLAQPPLGQTPPSSGLPTGASEVAAPSSVQKAITPATPPKADPVIPSPPPGSPGGNSPGGASGGGSSGVVWSGLGADTKWSTPANWVGNAVPTATDTVVFDATSSKDATVDIDVTVAALNVQSGYTGTIDFGSHPLSVSQDHVVADGTVHYGTGIDTIGGAFHVQGGTAALQSVRLTVNGLLDHTGGTLDLGTATLLVRGDVARSGGTLSAASSTIRLQGSADQSVDFGPAPVFGTVAVEKSGGVLTFANDGFTATTLSVSPGNTVDFQAYQSFALTNLTVGGTPGAAVTLEGTDPFEPWFLKVSPAGLQSIHYVNVGQSDARGGAIVNATDHGIDLGFNTNVDFGIAPTLEHATARSITPSIAYLRYSEAMDPATVTRPANYTVSGGLSVTAASLSSDQRLLTLALSGPAVIGTTAITAGGAIRSLVGRNLPLTTKTIEAGTSNGNPDAEAIQLSLTTDSSHSVIQQSGRLTAADVPDQGLQFTLIVTAPGTNQTVVYLGQRREPGGNSAVFFGEGGGATFTTVTTSGGPVNQAMAIVRADPAGTGSYQNDFTIRAFTPQPTGPMKEVGAKPATVISVDVGPACVYDHASQSITVTPAIQGVKLFSKTWVLDKFHASPTKTFAFAPIPPTDAQGQTILMHREIEADAYVMGTVQVDTRTSRGGLGPDISPGDMDAMRSGNFIDTPKSDNNGDYGSTEDKVPPTKTPDDSSTCPDCKPKDGGQGSGSKDGGQRPGSTDPSRAESKVDLRRIYFWSVQGRGIDYEMGGIYRSGRVQYRQTAALHDFGEGWTYAYADERLVKDGTGSDEDANYLNFRDGNSGTVFVNIGTGSWAAPVQNFVQLRKNPFTSNFEIRDQSGMVRVYQDFSDLHTVNTNGRLIELRDRNDNRMTFHYEQIDPDGMPGHEKFVLAYVIDTMGREIRYQYYAKTSQTIHGRVVTITHPAANTAAYGRLAKVIDFKGDLDFSGQNQWEDYPGQVNNRTVTFDYDAEGNLVRVSSPAVAGTPNGNDFPTGKTYRFQYITEGDLPVIVPGWGGLTTGAKNEVRLQLLHKVTDIFYPNEIRNAVDVNPAVDKAAEIFAYDVTSGDTFLGSPTSYTIAGTNDNGVPSGGTIHYAYTDLNPGHPAPPNISLDPTLLYNIPSVQVDVVDRNGNQAQYIYGAGNTLLDYREFTRGFRAVEPAEYLLQVSHNKDRLLQKRIAPEGNTIEYTFNENSPDRLEQGNVIRSVQTPDVARGGDQPKIEQVFVYNPIYNRPCLVVYARGADMDNNGFTPPIPDPAGRIMTDPYDPSKRLNMRYVKIDYFDFQESKEKAKDAPDTRLNKGGKPGKVKDSPLIAVDPNVLTTEVWLVQTLGLSEDADGLAELRSRLAANLTKLGLGDLNGDGEAEPAIAGNIVRETVGSPVLLPGSNQHALEKVIDPIDLIRQDLPYDQGGTNEGTHGDQLQTIVTMFQYNQFGQLKKTITPEGNVNTQEYFPENNPNGDGHITPPPADGRTLDGTTGGYLKKTVTDTTRSYYDQDGHPSNGSFSNNNTNPAPTNITVSFTRDTVGNVKTMTNGRGIRTDSFVNELNQVVQTKRAADISAVDPNDPLKLPGANGPLTAFGYLSRSYFDYNNNVVLAQVEDRGNTSNVDGNGLGPIPAQAVVTTPGLDPINGGDPPGGVAFADTLNLYDRINDRIETDIEVRATPDPLALKTRYRYDGNQNRVFTIYPAGNADSAVFDERDLLFESTRGANARPGAGLFGPADPVTFNRLGGAGTDPSTTTRNYDLNGNLIETVDAQDNGGAKSMIHPLTPDAGDVTKITYDGYDRRKTVTDPLGNQTIYTYDPDSNIVRVVQTGDPVDDVFGNPNSNTLAVTEYVHDELSRVIVTHQVLFKTPYPVGQGPQRDPTLTDTPDMDALAAYLADAPSNTAAVPGRNDITVLGRVSTLTEYDRESRPTFTVTDTLHNFRTDYDGARRVIKTTDSALSNGFSGGAFNPNLISGNLVETAYDANSNPIERKETDVTTVAGVPAEFFRTTSLYDSLDRLQTVADNAGQTTDYHYDSRGNLVARADAVGPVTTRTINRRGLGSTASILVNDFGNVTRTRYDGISRTLETETMLTASGQGNGSYIGATLEGVLVAPPPGYLDPTQSGDGLISVYYAYDANSQLLALRDDDGNTTEYIYDNQNRRLVERKGLYVTGTAFTVAGGDSGAFNVPLRGGVMLVPTGGSGTDISTSFDKDSNIISTTDEAGNIFICTFDALNRKKSCSITRAAGFIGTTSQSFQYDGLSRLTVSFDNNDPATTNDDVTDKYFYDSLSRKVEESQQIGGLSAKATSCNFDIVASGAVQQPSACIYPDGRQVDNTYDRLDRLVSRRDHGQAKDIGTYEYIGKDRVAVLTYENGTRLTHIGQVAGHNADVGFDDLRRVVNHRWEAFTPGTPIGNGTRIVEFGYKHGDNTPAYDRTNNKKIEEKLHDPRNSEVYTYDSAYRLKTYDHGTLNAAKTAIIIPTPTPGALQTQTWNLDGLGNWVSNKHTEGGVMGVEDRMHGSFNEIVKLTGMPYDGNATGTYLYDKNGNLLDDGVRTYQWDALNRLRKVFKKTDMGNVLVAEYTYDNSNHRMRKIVSNGGVDGTAPNGTTDFYYDDWRVMEEHDSTDTITQQYVYGNYLDELWALDNRRGGITVNQLNDGIGQERLFYHTSTLYSVYGLTDETGVLKEAYQYDAYGRATVFTGPGPDGIWFTGDEPQAKNSALNNPYTYTGQRLDAETGLMYYKNRYYVTGLGRFMSRDQIEYQDSINLYEYVRSRPIRFVDPLGNGICGDNIPKGCIVIDVTPTKYEERKTCDGKKVSFPIEWTCTYSCDGTVGSITVPIPHGSHISQTGLPGGGAQAIDPNPKTDGTKDKPDGKPKDGGGGKGER
jgi:RHS repeat-associated protein